MSIFLRKVLESVFNHRSHSKSNPGSSSSVGFQQIDDVRFSSAGEFDRLPLDIFIQILKLLGPKEATKLSPVCKSLRCLVSDNRLWMHFLSNQPEEPWDSIFFAETNLRSGFPLQTFPRQMHELSFMHIYGEHTRQRTRLPGAVIIDGGSGYCKFGWSKYNSPSGRSATFLEFGNIESPLHSRLQHFYATIYGRLQVKYSTQPIVVSVPISQYDDTASAKAARRQLKEAIYSALFGLNVPAVCAINQATLALFAARRTSGIVVNIGFRQTSVVPILHGKVMRKVGVEVVGMGASEITSFLREQMQQNNISFGSLYTVRSLKENLCYIALDYEAELSKDTKKSCEVAADGWFTLSRERFQTGEILFQPRIAGVHAMGLHQAVALCIEHCKDAELSGDWFKTVVLAGGTACLPGLPERLEKELCKLLPSSLSSGIKVIPPPYGSDSAWFGAKLVSNVSTFPESWCVAKKQFRYKSRRDLIR